MIDGCVGFQNPPPIEQDMIGLPLCEEGFMNEVFGSNYAAAYDIVYRDKDYVAECDLIERLFQQYGDGPMASVLDLGCGTGNHTLLLDQRGYEVVGVDRSASMLALARRKAATCDPRRDTRAAFYQGDIRNVDLQRCFDAVLIMFAVLGYQLKNADVLSALKTARRHLRIGGLLIFDVWYGPAVLHERPSQRVKIIPTPTGHILRVASGELDISRHLCTVKHDVWSFERDRPVSKTDEVHEVRYFFPQELRLFLQCTGLDFVRLGAFPEFDREPDETVWNVLGVARAV
jgi:SAM-dependent methyltransferase